MPPTRLPEGQIRHIEQTVIAYLDKNLSISNTELRALTGIKYDQATYFLNRMLQEGKLLRTGRTSAIRYIRPENATR
jgi:predicted HTH transcriptional regulator